MAASRGAPITIAIDPAVSGSLDEVRYALRTLAHTAGFATHFVWFAYGMTPDVYYGPAKDVDAAIRIPAIPWAFATAPNREPVRARRAMGLPFLEFPGETFGDALIDDRRLAYPSDVAFAAYWLLTGAVEPSYPRSRFDDLDLDRSVLVRDALLSQPLVSLHAAQWRARLDPAGTRALPWAWEEGESRFAFAFTHDVDYPELIRPIEVLRVLRDRGRHGIPLAARVASGRSHFWTFREWVELAATYGTRPCFYFMARQGSLWQYARGTPDDFYDVRAPRFQRLFAELRDAGCEIGLHASYHAHRSTDMLRREVQRIAEAAGVECAGNRHHYWHLDPDDPNETLRRHAEAGLRYDSSLGLEYYPGFRRGICHPFRPFHPARRELLPIVQLPPAWMDDHFDRRLAKNRIDAPDAAARALLDAARATQGIVVVDYHSRGMNGEFYPRYGPWLTRFARANFDASLRGMTPREIHQAFLARERALEAVARDDTMPSSPPRASSSGPTLEITAMETEDIAAVAALHHSLFGDPRINGHSIATLGAGFLADAFYALNLDNPGIRCLVARLDGRVIGFSVYAIDRDSVFRHLVRRHPLRLMLASARTILRRPSTIGAFVSNARYMGSERLPFLDDVPGWWIVAGVEPEARTPEFEARIGRRVAAQLFDSMEAHMRSVRCNAWYGVVRPDNPQINAFLQRRGARDVGTARAQGLTMRYYVRRYGEDS
ncbi:MAG: hypothetical protein AMXMBFR55_19270 [Gemmatimonadota bacterium]